MATPSSDASGDFLIHHKLHQPSAQHNVTRHAPKTIHKIVLRLESDEPGDDGGGGGDDGDGGGDVGDGGDDGDGGGDVGDGDRGGEGGGGGDGGDCGGDDGGNSGGGGNGGGIALQSTEAPLSGIAKNA